MKSFPKTWPVLLGVLALLGLVLGGLGWTRVRSSRTAEQMLRHMPGDAQIYAFLDVELLRQTGVLERLAGARGAEDGEYRRFVENSGFNYRQDLDAVVLGRRGTAQYAVIAGRFDAAKLKAYAMKNAGLCTGEYCSVPGAPTVSFAPIRAGWYAFASGTGDARELLAEHAPAVTGEFLGSPVWATGLGPSEVPLLQGLPGVERLTLWLTPRLPASVEVKFALEARDAASATSTAQELGALAKGELARYVSGGTVESDGRRVRGRLPVAVGLLEALVGGTSLR